MRMRESRGQAKQSGHDNFNLLGHRFCLPRQAHRVAGAATPLMSSHSASVTSNTSMGYQMKSDHWAFDELDPFQRESHHQQDRGEYAEPGERHGISYGLR